MYKNDAYVQSSVDPVSHIDDCNGPSHSSGNVPLVELVLNSVETESLVKVEFFLYAFYIFICIIIYENNHMT